MYILLLAIANWNKRERANAIFGWDVEQPINLNKFQARTKSSIGISSISKKFLCGYMEMFTVAKHSDVDLPGLFVCTLCIAFCLDPNFDQSHTHIQTHRKSISNTIEPLWMEINRKLSEKNGHERVEVR